MQQTTATDVLDQPPLKTFTETSGDQPGSPYQVIRRNGKLTAFDKNKILVAMTKAFLAVEGGKAATSTRIHETVEKLTDQLVPALFSRRPDNEIVHIEDIQDQVELWLMRAGEHKVARAYVLYRDERAREREQEKKQATPDTNDLIKVIHVDGETRPFDQQRISDCVQEAIYGLENVHADDILKEVMRNVFDGIREEDLRSVLVMSARTLIDREPEYSQVSARLLLDNMRQEALSFVYEQQRQASQKEMKGMYGEYFKTCIKKAIELELLDSELGRFDLEQLAPALDHHRDYNFTYLGLQTLYDRYFIQSEGVRFELPQVFFMRVAMGLSINEVHREKRAIEFYHLLSSFDFMCSTPTLFNSGTLRPQLSSCYLTTVPDDLEGIYNSFRDNALLSKFAGGLGNDWTRVRAMGAYIKGTNGQSQGVVPFLKVANDTAVAVNQGGKRKGATCAYLETWHIDIDDFLELRKNTGDERRRTHDMNTANWIPDLFMKRVVEEKEWTLFSPEEVPDLHDLYGQEFEKAYTDNEQRALSGEIKLFRKVSAPELWRKMLGMLFETGHPWITFKDPCNIRYTNQHAGKVHSSNLCTEITLHTNDREIAVCNLGSVNLARHVNQQGVDTEKLQRTVKTAMRMLDNVIDYNFYSVPQARCSNLLHRPVGLGIMGFQDALYIQKIAYASEEAVEFSDLSMEAVSYYAIQASVELAEERGRYQSFEGSLWSRGILPVDSMKLLEKERGNYYQVDDSRTMDWKELRQRILASGMRNSNCLAIAPTATISNICGVTQSIEPTYQNMYVKSNLSGEFTVLNPYLVQELKQCDLWDEVMVNDLKYFDGSVQSINRVPDDIKSRYATAFEIDARWLVEAGARRQKWIDQSQSLNLYMAEASGKKLDQLYKLAWVRGLKTTYYLRSLGATHIDKSSRQTNQDEVISTPKVCSILEPDCEACQ